MPAGIQIIGMIFALVQSYFTFLHFKRREFTLNEFIGWMLIWLSFALVTFFPQQFSIFANSLGAFRPFDLFTVIGFFVVLSISFYTYVSMDRVRKQLEIAIRELALNEIKK